MEPGLCVRVCVCVCVCTRLCNPSCPYPLNSKWNWENKSLHCSTNNFCHKGVFGKFLTFPDQPPRNRKVRISDQFFQYYSLLLVSHISILYAMRQNDANYMTFPPPTKTVNSRYWQNRLVFWKKFQMSLTVK